VGGATRVKTTSRIQNQNSKRVGDISSVEIKPTKKAEESEGAGRFGVRLQALGSFGVSASPPRARLSFFLSFFPSSFLWG